MNRAKKREILLLAANAVIVCEILYLLYLGVSGAENVNSVGSHVVEGNFFTAFTADSNILMGLCAAVQLCVSVCRLRDPEYVPPLWTDRLYHIGTTAVALTLVVVVVFLAPMMAMMGVGYFALFTGTNFFHHLINPLLAIISFTLLNRYRTISLRKAWLGCVPAVIYGFVYLVCVVFLKIWADFYNFTLGGRYALVPVVMIVIFALTYGLSAGLTALHNNSVKIEKETI